MHQKNQRPDDLDLGSSSMSSSYGYLNGTVNCVANDNFHLDYMEERAVRGHNRGNFDEIDLVSECSTPIVYTPGKYLQLCDISSSTEASDVTLWPSSLGAPPTERDTASLVLPHKKPFEDSSFLHNFQHSSSPSERRNYRKIRCLPNKYLVIIAVCLIIALSALGSLAVLI